MATRRPSPVLLLVLGLTCALGAAACWALSTTVRDERTIMNEAFTIARSEPVREAFGWKIADAIVPHSAVSSPAEINRANGIARQAVASPAFQQAFASALPAIYASMVDGAPGDIPLDPELVRQAIASTGTAPPPNLAIQVSADDLPDLRGSLDLLTTGVGVLGALAALLIGVALALSTHRNRAIMRIGRWLITTGIVTVVVFWALPTLALLPLGGWIGVIGIVLATGDWLVVPAAVLTAFGIAIIVVGRAGEAQERHHELSAIPMQSGRSPTRPRIS